MSAYSNACERLNRQGARKEMEAILLLCSHLLFSKAKYIYKKRLGQLSVAAG